MGLGCIMYNEFEIVGCQLRKLKPMLPFYKEGTPMNDTQNKQNLNINGNADVREKRKYSHHEWNSFIDQANERIHTDSYDEYYKEYTNTMNLYFRKNRKNLDESYQSYKEALSTDFLNDYYQRIDETELDKALRRCKIMVLTFDPIEKAILHYHIIKSFDKKYNSNNPKILFESEYYYIFKWGEYWIAHFHQQQIEAFNRVHEQTVGMLECFRPNVIFSIGVVFGIDFKAQNIGDVIISKEFISYEAEKILTTEKLSRKMIDSWLNVRFVNSNGFLDDVTYGGIVTYDSSIASFRNKDILCSFLSNYGLVAGVEPYLRAINRAVPKGDIPYAAIYGIYNCGDKNYMSSTHEEKSSTSKNEVNYMEDCLKAYAMQKAISKCDILFNDISLFSSSKMSAVESERAVKNRIYFNTILSHVLILAFGLISIFTHFSSSSYLDYEYIKMIIIIFCVSLFSIFFTLITIRRKAQNRTNDFKT